MSELEVWAAWIAAIAGAASATYAYFALKDARRQNSRQARMSRVVSAQQMTSELAQDELLSFAVNRLDWGAGLVQIPPSWRTSPDIAFVQFDITLFRKALLPRFEVSQEPVGMLYRHSFIRLYDHLTRVGSLVKGGLIELRDLPAHGWIANQLSEWMYVSAEERPTFFLAAIKAWYPDGLALGLIDALCTQFPKEGRDEKATGRESPA
jgi:hypothetical protein